VKRVLVFVGSRANFGRLKMLIDKLLEKGHTVDIIQGSYNIPGYERNIVLKVDNLMYYDTNSNMSTSVAIIALAVSIYLSTHKSLYDVAIVHADRYENLGFSIACSYTRLPLLHTEGGEVTGNIDNKVRNAITSLADIHCAASQEAFERIDSDKKFFTGSPAIDFVKSLNLHGSLPRNRYILALYNPSDNEDPRVFQDAIREISSQVLVIWVNPNFDPGCKEVIRLSHELKGIEFLKDLTPEEFYGLMYDAVFMVGNSSSGIKEGAFLGLPYLLVGDRQGKRQVVNNVTRVKLDKMGIIAHMKNMLLSCHGAYTHQYFGDFGWGYAAESIVKVIERWA
jgi:UDP-N-acetylglucosamine 2-epimerase/N-acetylmannosamine kinase